MTPDEIAEFGKSMQRTAMQLLPLIPDRSGSAAPPMPEMVEMGEGVWLSREIVDMLSPTNVRPYINHEYRSDRWQVIP